MNAVDLLIVAGVAAAAMFAWGLDLGYKIGKDVGRRLPKPQQEPR